MYKLMKKGLETNVFFCIYHVPCFPPTLISFTIYVFFCMCCTCLRRRHVCVFERMCMCVCAKGTFQSISIPTRIICHFLTIRNETYVLLLLLLPSLYYRMDGKKEEKKERERVKEENRDELNSDRSKCPMFFTFKNIFFLFEQHNINFNQKPDPNRSFTFIARIYNV